MATSHPNRDPRPEWALALHGGAGTISRLTDTATRIAHEDGLRAALAVGRDVLAGGGTSLDAVERVVTVLEDDPHFNAGKGAVYNNQGEHELDASIMNGTDLACGAVAAVRTVKNPIQLARRVMEASPHVLFAGPGADQFAREQGFEAVPQEYFRSEGRRRQWEKAREGEKGTVGAVALDRAGHLAAATSTGGTTNKRVGRVGDSPIIGAGTYARDATCAVSATGTGEEIIRHTVAAAISAYMEHRGSSLEEAAEYVIRERLRPGDGGVIGVAHTGELVALFNTNGMYRGLADSSGRFEVAIW